MITFSKILTDKLFNLLSKKHKIKVYIHSEISYAGVSNGSIYISDKLFEKLSHREIDAVMLHEAAHIINKDVLKRKFFCVIYFLIVFSYVFIMVLIVAIHQPNNFILMLFSISTVSPFIFVDVNYNLTFGRRKEYRCDLFAAKNGYKNEMISLLEKIGNKKTKFYDSHPSKYDRIKNIEKCYVSKT